MSPSVSPIFQRTLLYRGLRVICIACLIIFVFSYLDLYTETFDFIEQQTYGDRLEVAGLCDGQLVADAQKKIVVVATTDDTYRWAGNGGTPPAILPRTYYAELIRRLSHYGAKVIAFDILFDRTHPDQDQQLAAAMKKSGNIVIGCADDGDNETEIVYPEKIFRDAGCRIGITRVHSSIDRPVIDDIEPTVPTSSGLIPALSIEAVRMYRGIDGLPLGKTSGPNAIPRLPVVVDYSNRFPAFKIRYLYNGATVFTPIDLQTVDSASPAADGVYREIFQGKIVLVGDTTKLNGDNRFTPIESMPGVIIQAHAIATLLSGKYIYEAKPIEQTMMLGFLVALTTLLATIWPLKRVAFLILLILPISFLLNVWLFVREDIYYHLAAPSGAVLLTALCILLERGLTEESEKGRIRALLQRYVNPRIADHILAHPELIGSRGKRAVGTMLFADVRGFTRLSEELSPEELVSRMNEYFQTMTEIVFKHDGTAASIVGDAMLAVFGIPVPMDDHADRAVAAAIQMFAAAAVLQEKWGIAAHGESFSGIGINSGEVIVGEVGGKQLRNFTVYGLQVNIASRVEELSKMLGKILITRSTYELLKNPIPVKGPQKAKVDGVAEPLDVFEVIS